MNRTYSSASMGMVWLCVVAACHGAPARSPVAAPVTCPRAIEVPPALVAAGATTIFGEIHGTREAPELFGDVVCHAAARGGRVVVGLELPSSESDAVRAFLAGGTSLTSRPFWTQPYQSGRTSAAMLALLTELRRIIQVDPRVELFLFDIPFEADPQNRDARMAETVRAKRAAEPDAAMLLFTGNVHAQKTKGTAWDPSLEPMAYHLVTHGVQLTSLNIRNPKGTAWVCHSNDASSCGESPIGGRAPEPGAPTRGIELIASDGYDGVYIVPSATAAPPAAR